MCLLSALPSPSDVHPFLPPSRSLSLAPSPSSSLFRYLALLPFSRKNLFIRHQPTIEGAGGAVWIEAMYCTIRSPRSRNVCCALARNRTLGERERDRRPTVPGNFAEGKIVCPSASVLPLAFVSGAGRKWFKKLRRRSYLDLKSCYWQAARKEVGNRQVPELSLLPPYVQLCHVRLMYLRACNARLPPLFPEEKKQRRAKKTFLAKGKEEMEQVFSFLFCVPLFPYGGAKSAFLG